MLFERIDVRPVLLSKNSRRTGRIVRTSEIYLSACTSKRALELLEQGVAAARIYKVEVCRMRYCDAIDTARRERDDFIQAAAIMKQALLMDGMTPLESQVHFFQEAVELLDYEVFRLVDQLLDDPDQARIVIPPRHDLLTLARHNLAAFELRRKSTYLADTKERLDDLLGAGNNTAAENVARTGCENAVKLFGADHWWGAVMGIRLATALLRQKKVGAAAPLVRRAAALLQEWTDESDSVFNDELTVLSAAEKDLQVLA